MRFRIEVSGEHTEPVEARADLDKQIGEFVEAIRRRGWLEDCVVVDLDASRPKLRGRSYDHVIVDDLAEFEKDEGFGFGVPERDEGADIPAEYPFVVLAPDEHGNLRYYTAEEWDEAKGRSPIPDFGDNGYMAVTDIPADAEQLAAETGAAVDRDTEDFVGDVLKGVREDFKEHGTLPKMSLPDRIVRAREFAGNAQLGTRELAEMFGVSRYAIRKALEQP